MDPSHFQNQIVTPALQAMGMYSQPAVNLMMMTWAHESLGGEYLVQLEGGRGLGVFQIEPVTARDIVFRYLERRDDLQDRFERAFQLVNSHEIDWENVDLDHVALKLVSDLRFSTAVARIKYWMDTKPLPAADDLKGLARYYKRVYNSHEGAAQVDQVLHDYHRYVTSRQ